MAARARRKAGSACRVGGGLRICGLRKASSSENVRALATMCLRLKCVVRAILIPRLRHPEERGGRHLDDRKHLAAFSDENAVGPSHDSEGAPKPTSLELVEPSLDDKFVAKFRGSPVINFCPDDDRVFLVTGHLGEAKPQLFGQQSARDF